MLMEDRHRDILLYLDQVGHISVSDIQHRYEVSFDTARRDLRLLETNGKLKRTRGGALSLRQVGENSQPASWTPKDIKEVRENYWAIAREAAILLKPHDVVYVTSGSVGYFLIQNLPEEMPLTVVTNSIVNAEELRKHKNVTCIMVGGTVDERGCCKDSFALDILRRLRFDVSFMTGSCISAEFGMSVQTTMLEVSRCVLEASKKVVGLFPTEKLGFESIVQICRAERLSCLITDWDAPDEELDRFRKLGLEVRIAKQTACFL